MAAIGRVVRSLVAAPHFKRAPVVAPIKLGSLAVRNYFLDARTFAAIKLRDEWTLAYQEQNPQASLNDASKILDAKLVENPSLLGPDYEKLIIEQDSN
jgi:hypothetical protein